MAPGDGSVYSRAREEPERRDLEQDPPAWCSIEKSVILALIDDDWKEHLREMDDLSPYQRMSQPVHAPPS